MTNPGIYSIDIVDNQTLEQPRLFYVEIVETNIPISLPFIYDINVNWVDYIIDNNALFAFGGF